MKNKEILPPVPPQQRIRDKSGRFLKGQTGCGNPPGKDRSCRDEGFKQFARKEVTGSPAGGLHASWPMQGEGQKDRGSGGAFNDGIRLWPVRLPSNDRERLDIEKRLADARIAQIEREESEGAQQVEVIISGPAKELGM